MATLVLGSEDHSLGLAAHSIVLDGTGVLQMVQAVIWLSTRHPPCIGGNAESIMLSSREAIVPEEWHYVLCFEQMPRA